MQQHMRTIPLEIAITISGYMYNPQPQILCDDIKSYHRVVKLSREIYRDRYPPGNVYNGCDNDWLINDIFRFLNRDVPTMSGYQDYFKSVIRRQYRYLNKKDSEIVGVLSDLDNYYHNNHRLVSLLIGLLTPMERSQLISFFHNYQIP